MQSQQLHTIDSYHALFRATNQDSDPFWLKQLRENGLQCFTDLGGFPQSRVEEWKYTPLRSLEKISFISPESTQTHSLESLRKIIPHSYLHDHYVISMVDGVVYPALSHLSALPHGVMISSLHDVLKSDDQWLQTYLGCIGTMKHHPFMALNTAFIGDGVIIRIPAGIEVEKPIVVLLLTSHPTLNTPRLCHPRLLIVAEAGSQATVLEHHIADTTSSYLANGTVEIVIEPKAQLRHYKVQQEGTQGYHLATNTIHLTKESHYHGFTLTVGGRLARNEVHVTLGGRSSHCHVNGAYLIQNQQHCDATSVITHAYPDCTSRQVYKGVIDDQAHAVFQGKIIVQPDAQKTDGYQLNQALLLSDDAQINSKPELEIFADDVKCSHGATSGALNEEALFYCRARGIDYKTARSLLIAAFVHEAIDEIDHYEIRKGFDTIVHQWLTERSNKQINLH